MQKLSDVLGPAEGTLALQMCGGEDRETSKPSRHEEGLYIVTIIVPVAAACIDEGKLVIRTEVLARSEAQAMDKAGVSAKRG